MGGYDRVLKDVPIRLRSDRAVIEAVCTVTCRGDDVQIELDADVSDVPLRILGRRVVPRVYQGLAWGPGEEVLSARWADVGSEQVGVLSGEGYECLFVLEGIGVALAPEAEVRPKVVRKEPWPSGPDA